MAVVTLKLVEPPVARFCRPSAIHSPTFDRRLVEMRRERGKPEKKASPWEDWGQRFCSTAGVKEGDRENAEQKDDTGPEPKTKAKAACHFKNVPFPNTSCFQMDGLRDSICIRCSSTNDKY
ncbi:hypothetical protein scyTo_0014856 [Scyliorhinus torazame]|uniref:Uncharacterized protein n=1 Tax=Scyliorhinus torazame TaxID=75743 RepID=A0A401NWA0_SCYTO|nr:hypothetical protein [Scyliorhinus torazame]